MSEIPYSVRGGRRGAASLDALSDVTITNVQDADLLSYDVTSNQWINSAQGYLTSAEIYNLGGLTWSNIDNNEIIRRVDATNAEGAGMKLTDTTLGFDYKKTLNFFNRVAPLNIIFGAIQYIFEGVANSYTTHIAPKSGLIGTTYGLFLKASGLSNNVFVGINKSSPSKSLEVGTTFNVNDINNKVGINKLNPDEQLDINGKLRIEADTTQTIRFFDTQGGGGPDENGRIEVAQDGGGGEVKIYTLETGGGTPNERLSVNRRGALGLSGLYGSSGQVLQSNGSGSAVSWTNLPVSNTKVYATRYYAGSGSAISNPSYINSSSLTWSPYGSFSDANLFSTVDQNAVFRIQRDGVYQVYLKLAVSNTSNTNDMYAILTHKPSGSGSWVDITTSLSVENSGDTFHSTTFTMTIIKDFDAGDEITAQIVGANFLRGDIPGNNLNTRQTYMCINNVD